MVEIFSWLKFFSPFPNPLIDSERHPTKDNQEWRGAVRGPLTIKDIENTIHGLDYVLLVLQFLEYWNTGNWRVCNFYLAPTIRYFRPLMADQTAHGLHTTYRDPFSINICNILMPRPGHLMLFWAPGARVQPAYAEWWYNLPPVTLGLGLSGQCLICKSWNTGPCF